MIDHKEIDKNCDNYDIVPKHLMNIHCLYHAVKAILVMARGCGPIISITSMRLFP